MAEHLKVVPAELRDAAGRHRATAAELAAASSAHDDMLASLDSLGPVFAEFRDAGRSLLDQRRICYERQAAAHAHLADSLARAADVWESQDEEAAGEFRALAPEGGP